MVDVIQRSFVVKVVIFRGNLNFLGLESRISNPLEN